MSINSQKIENNTNQDQNFTEFNYLDGFYLKISYTQSIIITVYNLDCLDGKREDEMIEINSKKKYNYKKTVKKIKL